MAGAYVVAGRPRRSADGRFRGAGRDMLKLGGYGFLRFSLPIVPDASHDLAGMMIALSLIASFISGWWRWCRRT